MSPAIPLAAVLAAWVLLYFQIDPVPTWFYVFAWYPTLALLDAVATRFDGRPSALWRRSFIGAFAWSPVVWLVFEAANFRLENWYYVSLPHAAWERWTGIILSFATVVPALLLGERALDAAGVFHRGRGPRITVGRHDLGLAVALGLGMAALSLGYPALFFPLIWGAVLLVLDPFVFKSMPALSLIGDLQRGYWGRLGRIMVAGLGIGLLWETYNYWARGKWIYTVPWLENVKLFEMPPFGFLGFPVFALEAWAMYAMLCTLGLARPLEGSERFVRNGSSHGRRLMIAAPVAISFAVLTLLGMERWTISSTTPVLAEMPGVGTAELERLMTAGFANPFDLARADPDTVATAAMLDAGRAVQLVRSAQLMTLRGIGAEHAQTLGALGIRTVCDLARREPALLMRDIRDTHPGPRPTAPEIRQWIRAASRSCRG